MVVLWHFPDPRETAEKKAALRVAKVRIVFLHHQHWRLFPGLGERIPKFRVSPTALTRAGVICSDRDNEISEETSTSPQLRI